MSEKFGLGLFISWAEIKIDVNLLLRFLMNSMNSFLPWVKHLRYQHLLLMIISVIISLLLIDLVHSSWLSSYLNGRVQTTQVHKQISSKRNVIAGVPQGCVLGPLLFLIYINDIYNPSEKLSFHLFADDTNIYLLYADKDLKSTESVTNIELQKVCD